VRKEEVAALLGREQRPIEDYLNALTDKPLSDLAIAYCALRIEEAAPALLAMLTKAADGEARTDEEKRQAFRSLYLLGGARQSEAFQPLLRLLRRPQREVDELLGDTITEALAKIAAGAFDNDVDALFGAITDGTIFEYTRKALLGAATFLTWEGRIDRDRMHRFLERFYQDRLAADGDYVWIGWLEAIALLGLRDLAPLVHRAWDEGIIPPGVFDRRHFDQDLAAAERAPGDVSRLERANLGYIEDVLQALQESPLSGILEGLGDQGAYEAPITPVINPMRRVGRNDPCPCGSGKKAKKCCLAN
jgi:hypothetical protein